MLRIPRVAALVAWAALAFLAGNVCLGETTNLLRIQAITVDGKPVSWKWGSDLHLGANPQSVSIYFGPDTNAARPVIRLRFKMDGRDTTWQSSGGDMYIVVNFVDEKWKKVRQESYKVEKDSLGWKGTLENSLLTHRFEVLTVPPRACRAWVSITSAGPPATIGLYIVSGFEMSEVSITNGARDTLIRGDDLGCWVRDGTSPNMATIMGLKQNSDAKALAILDDDPQGHAEWHTFLANSPKVSPGDRLELEWNELYTIGIANPRITYPSLPPGDFVFHISELTAMGEPTGEEDSLRIRVSLPIWQKPFPWVLSLFLLLVAMAGSNRYYTRRKFRLEMDRLERQREVEQERLRIARDIHDDLGARVTQISMLSSMATCNPVFPKNARGALDQIFQISQELISALYETVWSVKPENDNLYALGNYLRLISSQVCDPAQLRCRLQVPDLPREVEVSSQTRHNIAMAAKEAMHNVIKHAQASEICITVTLEKMLLSISIRDNGCGFNPTAAVLGNGLSNMRDRLEKIGGRCRVEALPGAGTTVWFELMVGPGEIRHETRPASGLPG